MNLFGKIIILLIAFITAWCIGYAKASSELFSEEESENIAEAFSLVMGSYNEAIKK